MGAGGKWEKGDMGSGHLGIPTAVNEAVQPPTIRNLNKNCTKLYTSTLATQQTPACTNSSSSSRTRSTKTRMASSGGGSGGQPPLVKGFISLLPQRLLRKEATLAFLQENCGIKHSPKSGRSSKTKPLQWVRGTRAGLHCHHFGLKNISPESGRLRWRTSTTL